MFSHKSFNPTSFSPISFHMAMAPTDYSRSGWFRLLLADIQAESLKEDERRKHEQEQRQETSSRKGTRKKVRKPVVVTRTEERTDVEQPADDRELPPVRLKPLYRPVEQPVIQDTVFGAIIALKQAVESFEPIRLGLESRQQEAANDEDDEEVLLLLAA